MSQVFQVRRHADPKDLFFVSAACPDEAIEVVTLRLADLEGRDAWAASPATPPFEVAKGEVFDAHGKPIAPVEL